MAGKAEEERFELPVPFSTTVFKTAPLNHSGTPPGGGFFAAAKVEFSFQFLKAIAHHFLQKKLLIENTVESQAFYL